MIGGLKLVADFRLCAFLRIARDRLGVQFNLIVLH